MNEEEKKAIGLLKALNNTEEKCKMEKTPYNLEIKRIMITLLPEDYGVFRILLNLIEKQQKENEELNDKYATFVKMSSEVIANSIPVQKVKDKIEELEKNLYTVEHYETVGAINVLQEILEGRK